MKAKNALQIISWSLYDLANQFFALNVVSLYFVRWLTLEKQMPEALYSIAFGVSTVLIATLGPVLGVISDISGRRRPFLVWLTLLSVIFTIALGIDNILLGLLFFIIANFGCQTATIFYNSLMVGIAPEERLGLISGIGKVFSYAGAILALYLIKPVLLERGYLATFLPTGVLFLLFSLPCMIFVKDTRAKGKIDLSFFLKKDKLIEIFRSLKETAFNTRKFPGLLDFLKATFFGLCGVNVIMLFMSIYVTRVFKLDESQIINLIAFSTLFAILGSFVSGVVSDFLGHKRCLIAVFVLWAICFALGAVAASSLLYWAIGALVGMTLGATWVVSRALAIKLVPEDKIGEVFGLFNLVGYASSIIGALFWGIMLLALSSLKESGYRIALFSLTVFIIPGLYFLIRVPKEKVTADG